MTAKEYLTQAYKLNAVIKDKEERLQDLKEMSTSIGGIDYSKDRVQTSTSPDAGYTNQVLKIIELENNLQADIDRLRDLKIEINAVVEAVPDVDCSMLLSKRYILMKTWEQIAEEMNYSLSQIDRIHKKALSLVNVK